MDGPLLLPATLYQLHAPFSCFGRWSDESERAAMARPSASSQLLGNFFKWSILKLGSNTRLQFHSRFVRSPNRRAVFEWAAPPAAVATHNERVAKWGSGGGGRRSADLGYGMPHARTHT